MSAPRGDELIRYEWDPTTGRARFTFQDRNGVTREEVRSQMTWFSTPEPVKAPPAPHVKQPRRGSTGGRS